LVKNCSAANVISFGTAALLYYEFGGFHQNKARNRYKIPKAIISKDLNRRLYG